MLHAPPPLRPLLCALALACAAPAALLAQGAAPGEGPAHRIGDVPWDARAARHLMQRAGFGVSAAELPGLVARAPEEVVEELLTGGRPVEPFFARRFDLDQYQRMETLDEEQKRVLRARIRAADKGQLRACADAWVEDMLDGVDPLRDRMTLFWHGFFTTSARELRRNYEVVLQHEFLRQNALGSYADLLAGIVRDPAMLHYLDNSSSKQGNPNENLARELMELFSLGEGNYTEQDVQELARALTGYSADREGRFSFVRKNHDRGEKRILGERGHFDGDDAAEILLRQEACAEWVAGRLIEHLEGVAPDAERLKRYAALLRDERYELVPLLRRLLLDPAFYRAEVLGARVLGPVELVVSSARRLGVRPPGRFVVEAAASCGQRLFEPPNVKGWEEGEAWITAASLLQRGNVAGLMLGVVDLEQALAGGTPPRAASDDSMMGGQGMSMQDIDAALDELEAELRMDAAPRAAGPLPKELATLEKALGNDWQPRLNLTWRVARTGARGDGEVVDALLAALLAIDPPADARGPLVDFLRRERAALGLAEGELLDHPEESEGLLRRLAHLILSLPEAQLS